MKLYGVAAINMAPSSDSTMKLDYQNAKEWGGSNHQSHGLILAISLSKLKTHMVRKREIYSKDRFR